MKKSIALLLALLLMLTIFAGCGGKAVSSAAPATDAPAAPAEPEKQPEQQPPAQEPEQQPAPEGTALTGLAAQVFGESVAPEQWTLPLDDGSASLSLAATFPDPLFGPCPNGMADCDIYIEAEKQTGVHVEYIPLSTSESADKFPIMIGAGELPDIVGWGLNYVGGNGLAVQEGDYIPLNEVVAQYCPNFLNYMTADEDLLRSILVDGNVVNMGTLIIADCDPVFGPQIRGDLLEQLGKEVPYTIDEYYDVLTAFKTEFNLEEPYCLLGPGAAQNNYLVGAFGVAGYLNNFPFSVMPFYVEQGQIKFGIVEDGYRQYLELIRKWYDEGLISPEYYSKNANWNSPDFTAKIYGGKVGLWYSDYGNIGDINKHAEIEGFQAIGCYDAHQTKDSVNHFSEYTTKSGGNGCIISGNCENVKLAAQWLDFWYTEEGSLLANYGVQGRGFDFNAEGKPAYTEMVTNPEGFPMRDALLVYASNETISCVVDNDRLVTAYSAEDNEARATYWKEGLDNACVIPKTITDYGFTADEKNEFTLIYADIETLCTENISKFITGEVSMDGWADFVKSVWDMNLQGTIDIYQTVYDRVMGA